jgi:CBS domain-containing protein
MAVVADVTRELSIDPPLGPGAAVVSAAQLLTRHDMRALPVVEEGRLVGFITEHAITQLIASGRSPLIVQVREIAHDGPALHPGDALEAAAQALIGQRLDMLPVADEGRFVGVVLLHDVLAALRRAA